MKFSKYEGLGNDFVVVDATEPDELTSHRVAALCDRRFGVGADGVLIVSPGDPPHAARMRVVNADGSVPEMCGNGLRCVALHLAIADDLAEARYEVQTDAGPRGCRVVRDGDCAEVSVDMGEVRATGMRVVSLDGESHEVELADAGNPHAVLFGEFDATVPPSLGPRLERHPMFPRGTNVEFARVQGARIEIVVWERGVGLTLACGTGACATAVVARARGLVPVDGEITVALPGGELRILPEPRGRTRMTGPARRVFSGEIDVTSLPHR